MSEFKGTNAFSLNINNDGKTPLEEQQANALLISKAPEMLEMISELLKELEFHGYRHSTTIYNAQNLIKEAIELK